MSIEVIRGAMMVKTKEKCSSDLLTRAEAAEFLGVKKSTLDCWGYTGRHNLPFIKKGGKYVRYRLSDLQAFLDAGTIGTVPTNAD